MNGKLSWLLTSMVISGAVFAGDSDINITGQVVAMPCTVTNNSLNIDLGKVEKSVLSEAGAVSDAVPFSLVLENCPASTSKVAAIFDGQPTVDDATLYKNSGTATNVGVEVRGAYSGIVLGPGSTANPVAVDADHKAEFNLNARIKTVNGPATVGTVTATTLVTFTYQ